MRQAKLEPLHATALVATGSLVLYLPIYLAVYGTRLAQLTLAELSGLGVKRVSVGSALYRTAIGAFMRAAREMQESGSFSFADQAATPRDLSRIMR